MQSDFLELDEVQRMGTVERRGVGSHGLDAQMNSGEDNIKSNIVPRFVILVTSSNKLGRSSAMQIGFT
jgi:hypothetical protein